MVLRNGSAARLKRKEKHESPETSSPGFFFLAGKAGGAAKFSRLGSCGKNFSKNMKKNKIPMETPCYLRYNLIGHIGVPKLFIITEM